MMSELKPVYRVTLSEQVAMQISAMISSGKWKAGERLPSEADLCKMLHIGRSTLREALRSLAFVGMVHMRAGDGSYVGEGPSKLLERLFAHGMLNTERAVTDLCETRILLETELAALCAERATEEEIQGLESLVREMWVNVHEPGAAFLKLDMEFHFSIADASKNQILGQLMRTIRQLLEEYIVKSLRLTNAQQLTCQGHAKILEAVKEHNARKARASMREHVRKFQRGYKLIMASSDHRIEPSGTFSTPSSRLKKRDTSAEPTG